MNTSQPVTPIPLLPTAGKHILTVELYHYGPNRSQTHRQDYDDAVISFLYMQFKVQLKGTAH
jgi:hypothetical protein